jgi:hypothetical protein
VLLRTTVKESRSTRVGCRALWVAAASEALMAVFVTDLRIATLGEPLVRTIHGRIHDGLALFHGIAWTIAVVVLPIAFTADRRWFRISRVSWLLTLFIVWAVAARVLAPSYDSGLTQRIWIASIFGWGVIHAAAGGRRCAVRDGATAT